jgi:hypothetical protein
MAMMASNNSKCPYNGYNQNNHDQKQWQHVGMQGIAFGNMHVFKGLYLTKCGLAREYFWL